jgi:hypothetical protein
MSDIENQLEIQGLQETLRVAEMEYAGSTRTRAIAKIKAVHEIKSSLPDLDDLSFLHSGLAQTCLPHSRPASDSDPWMRSSGKFSLIISPGVITDEADSAKARYVGVPYGSKARLILIYLQTEAVKSSSRTVSLGPSLAAFLRSLGIASATGGKNGTITSVREQCLRIAQCNFTMQWSASDARGRQDIIENTRLVDGLKLWSGTSDKRDWAGTVKLSEAFLEHLRQHAVPLDKRALSQLSDNSLGLDLYTLLAYRLPRLSKPLHLRWEALQSQIGTSYNRTRSLAEKVKVALIDVKAVYPDAKVEMARGGITLYPSLPAVPKTVVNGFRIASG